MSAGTDWNALTAQLVNVLVGLSTALLGYVAGRLWQASTNWLRYRKARHFWRPVVEGKVQVVVSRFQPTEFREPTGLVGGGDAFASRQLSDDFREIGLKGLEVVFVDESDLDRRANLILIGGPDANDVTRQALALTKPYLQIVDPGPGLPMEIHDTAPPEGVDHAGPRIEAVERYAADPFADSDPAVDYGMIIRTRNPFNPRAALVVIAGTYGYGAWAGVSLARDNLFLKGCVALDEQYRRGGGGDWAPLECLFRVGIFDRRPHTPEIIRLRTLEHQLSSRVSRSSDRDGSSGSG